jgi:predicted transcriptional regulator
MLFMSTRDSAIRPSRPLERFRRILETSDEDRILSDEWAQQLNLSLPQLRQYFHVMVQKGLLAKDIIDDQQNYRLTPHGQRFLAWYQRIQQELAQRETISS